jgi:predicted nucleotidyltransferase
MSGENPMNLNNQWRLEMARQIMPVYAANPKVAVVAVSGSVGRGWADRYSDIELDVYILARTADG